MLIGYVLIGLLYVLINIFIRDIEPDDPMLPLVWWFLWPICFVALAILIARRLIKGKQID